MSVFDLFRSKLKHPDPAVRASAVARLNDDAQLVGIVENDAAPEVRRAAVKQINDADTKAAIAKGKSDVALTALEGVTEPRLVAAIAVDAVNPEVRAAAVARLEDRALIDQIVAQDGDAMVRLAASRKRCLADPRRVWLKELMAKLQIRTRPGGAEPEFHGSLEELSIALVGDARFRIDGVASDREETDGAGLMDLGVVELLAHERRSESTPPLPMAELMHFQISVWREGEDSYHGRLIQLRRRMTTNVGEWVASASGKRSS